MDVLNVLDIITAVIVIASIAICYVRGLLMSVFNLLSLFLSFSLARSLYPRVGDWLRLTPLNESLTGALYNWVQRHVSLPPSGQILTGAIESLPVPDMLKPILIDGLGTFTAYDISSACNAIAKFSAGLILDALAAVLVFIAVFALLRLAACLLKIISRLPVIRTFNHLGGGLMGFLIGALISWIVLTAMRNIFAGSADFPVSDLLDKSFIAKYFLFAPLQF